jgi:hypothetical protein
METAWKSRTSFCPTLLYSGCLRRTLSCTIVATSLVTGAVAQEAEESSFPRITIEAPFLTRHVPHDQGYDDHNWGAFIDLQLIRHFSLVGGDFINSFRRNTAFAGIAYTPFYIELPNAEIDIIGAVAADLNRGYKGYNKLDPLLGSVSVRLMGTHFDGTPLQFLNHLGLAVTVIPPVNGPITAINLAVTYTFFL